MANIQPKIVATLKEAAIQLRKEASVIQGNKEKRAFLVLMGLSALEILKEKTGSYNV